MQYLVDFKPVVVDNLDYNLLANIESKIQENIPISIQELNYFLDNIVYICRKKINNKFDNYTNKCDLSQSIMTNYFRKINCFTSPLATHKAITNNIVGHSFLIIKLNVEDRGYVNILIDPTYIQFFTKDRCNKNCFIYSNNYPSRTLKTPDPGYYIKEEDMLKISRLINNGYIILDKEIARIYGDSFYNTKVGNLKEDNSFKTIPGNVYINAFLKGKEKLSYSEEDLQEQNYLINLFNERNYKIKK